MWSLILVCSMYVVCMCMYVVICQIDHCIHIHWCIVIGLGHNDPWVESHMWPQQTWGQRSCRGQWPLVQVFGKKDQCIHILWCIFKYYNDCKSMCSRKQARLMVREPPCWQFWGDFSPIYCSPLMSLHTHPPTPYMVLPLSWMLINIKIDNVNLFWWFLCSLQIRRPTVTSRTSCSKHKITRRQKVAGREDTRTWITSIL